ncbi:MAG: histidine kinase [Dinghuibacter sp.]|nr:histidine kinase [Dinghuibacter sp.]
MFLKTKCHNRIGFDDRLIMLVAIPFMAFVIPIIFFNCRFERQPFLTWEKYLATLFMTTVIWLGNRVIMIHSRSRYPEFKDVRKRLWVQSLLMLAFTLISNNLLNIIFDPVFHSEFAGVNFTKADKFIGSNAATLFCTIMVIAIYESVYFMSELRKSVQQQESLKRESLDAQLNALKTQVNPHFLFNNLNTLASVIPEDPGKAVSFVQQLSKLYRHILDVKDEPSIPLRAELDVMKAYIFLLKTRFGDNLEVSIQVPEEKLSQKIAPLSLQILMENAIKHNIVSSTRPLNIEVFTQNGSLLVSNNLQVKNQLNERAGLGLDNIRNRYSLLCNRNIEVTNNGNSFTVSVPLLND